MKKIIICIVWASSLAGCGAFTNRAIQFPEPYRGDDPQIDNLVLGHFACDEVECNWRMQPPFLADQLGTARRIQSLLERATGRKTALLGKGEWLDSDTSTRAKEGLPKACQRLRARPEPRFIYYCGIKSSEMFGFLSTIGDVQVHVELWDVATGSVKQTIEATRTKNGLPWTWQLHDPGGSLNAEGVALLIECAEEAIKRLDSLPIEKPVLASGR
jgi:hypothetical protein